MIIDELKLYNFGIFYGEQSVILTPPSEMKPIILIGGYNGAGKTTLLEAIQFVLYGNLSPFVRNKRINYEEYLARRINKKVNPKTGAFVELTFRSHEDGKEKNYTLRRSISKPKSRASEKLDVYIDGKHDAFLSETWLEHVNRFIPYQLAHLFFFDGEQIESLAEATHSSEVFHTAINALLGVDLVEQLKVDLSVLQRRKLKENREMEEIKDIEDIEVKINESEKIISSSKQELAGLQNKKDRILKNQKELKIEFSQQGGDLYECREQFEQAKKETVKNKESLEKKIIELASGSLPLVLVSTFLKGLRKQVDKELEAQQSKSIVDILEKRNHSLIQFLKKLNIESDTVKQVRGNLQNEIQTIEKSSQTEIYLDTDSKTKIKLDFLLEKELDFDIRNAQLLIKEFEKLDDIIDQYDQKLAAVPDQDALARIISDQKKIEKELKLIDVQYNDLYQLIEKSKRERDELTKKLNRMYEDNKTLKIQRSDSERVIKHSERLQNTLEIFKGKIVARNTEKLSKFILESYNLLLRKQGFINKIEIDPISYHLALRNGNNQEIKANDLSAGERQLLAVSMLWALGRASGKPIPVIIDTPLGRLDAFHRMNLVERYFPCASHQVLLLSTDEEIDGKYHEHLKKWIGHTYLLEYDEIKQSSSIKKDYYW